MAESSASSETRQQPWSHKACRSTGIVSYEAGAGVNEVMNRIFADHRRVAPQCGTDTSGLRSRDPEQGLRVLNRSMLPAGADPIAYMKAQFDA